jgi:L-ribulose-5-phosphate 4-epimerase
MMKVIGEGLKGGTSFMEDYTYHLSPSGSLVLGAHMLEICESIAAAKPSLEIHPLGIGGKDDPARLVFTAPAGAALNASIIDLGDRFRLVVNEVDVVEPPEPLPRLPVARAVWRCRPDFKTACGAWIRAGGAHHTAFSYTVTSEHPRLTLRRRHPDMLTELKREAYEANLALPAHGLVHLNFGNASAIDRRRGIVAIKPSGVGYADLRPSDIVLISLDGERVEGRLRPSSDTPTHLALYRKFKGAGGVAHTHSVHATAFAQAGMPIPVLGTTHSDFFNGPVPVTRELTAREIAGSYEAETGRVIVERFARLDPAEVPGVLVNRHGPFTWGPSAAAAVENAVALELCARLAVHTLALRRAGGRFPEALLARHFNRKHGEGAYYGQK